MGVLDERIFRLAGPATHVNRLYYSKSIVRQLTIWPRGGKQGAETLHPCNLPAFLDGSKPLQSITATNARGRQPAPSGAQQPVSAHHRNTSHNQLAHNYIPRHTRIHLAHTHTPAHSRIRLAGTRTPARNHIRSHTHTRVRLLANPLLALEIGRLSRRGIV